MKSGIRLVTEDHACAEEVRAYLASHGIALDGVSSAADHPGGAVLLLDVDTVPLSLLSRLGEGVFVVVLSSKPGARYLIESMRFGAFDCVFRPLEGGRLADTIRRALGMWDEVKAGVVEFPGEAGGAGVSCAIVGTSPELQEVCKTIGAVGRVDVPVLIMGESGTGKDLVAESIWKVSTRWEKPFVVLNCAAIPETLLEAELFGYEKGAFTGAASSRRGKFEEADGGIIFLDEVGDMSLALQAKLLRVLQDGSFHRIGDSRERRVDVRVIAATNKPLAELVRRGLFREDLYFRLNVVTIELPPLRERLEDIPLLVECFVRRHAAAASKEVRGVTKPFLAALKRHSWPGNIRELENAVRKAIVFARLPYLTSYDLEIVQLRPPADATHGDGALARLAADVREALSAGDYRGIMREVERVVIDEALKACGWNRSRTARLLGINRLTLRRKIEEYALTEGSEATGEAAPQAAGRG